jgi:hypothetical protein
MQMDLNFQRVCPFKKFGVDEGFLDGDDIGIIHYEEARTWWKSGRTITREFRKLQMEYHK